MIDHLNSSAQRFLIDVGRLERRAERAMQQLSSGLRVTRPSDAPDDLVDILSARTRLSRAEQIRQNLDRVQLETDVAENALSSATLLLDRATTLASQGAGTIATPESRRMLAAEVTSLLERLVAVANTTASGRYLFSGDADQIAPYSLDLTAANGVTVYAGSGATRQIEDPSGARFAVSRSARDIFESATATNIFATINGLRVALTNNDQPGIAAALGGLRGARDQMNQELSFYGTAQNQIAGALASARAQEMGFRVALARIRDADPVEASIELTQTETHREAAFLARARAPRTTLFDYLG